jgi:hypothetical protein
MRSLAVPAALSAVVLGCAAPGPATLRSSAWAPSSDSTASRRPLDCSDLTPGSPAGSVGDPLDPGRGKAVHEPNDLGAGSVRLVWSSTVSGVRLDWVAPAVPEAKNLWLLRVGDSGRCVVGTWNAAQLGFQVVRHTFRNDNKLEIVLLGLGPPPRLGWMVLVTDGSTLWSGLDSINGRPGALVAEQVEFREEADRLRLVVLDGGRTAVLDFDGRQFSSRP